MKINNPIKSIPILAILILIFFLNFSNHKQKTNLKILIWNTPSLTLGNYDHRFNKENPKKNKYRYLAFYTGPIKTGQSNNRKT